MSPSRWKAAGSRGRRESSAGVWWEGLLSACSECLSSSREVLGGVRKLYLHTVTGNWKGQAKAAQRRIGALGLE